MNRQPNLSDGSAGFLLDAESTLNLTPRLRCPIFDFVHLAAAIPVFTVFKYS